MTDMKAKTKKKAYAVINKAVLTLCLLLTLLPVYVMIVNSFKTRNQLLEGVLFLSFPLYYKNYADAFSRMLPFILNSVSVTVVATAGVTFLSALSGYAFGRYSFRFRELLFALIIVNMMIPTVLTLIPSYLIVIKLGIYNTHLALLFPYLAGGQVMGIFLVRGFVQQLSNSVFEAAKIDGATNMQSFTQIAVPLIKTILTTVSILTLLNVWNDIVWAMLVIERSVLKTIPLGLLEFNQQQGANKGALFAGYVLSSIPLLIYFLLNMRSFMDSLTEGAIK